MMIERLRKMLKNRKGFSLVELIVVIAILGVIAAIATPNVVSYLNSAKRKADVVSATAIANAINTAIANGEIKLPVAFDDVDAATDAGSTAIKAKVAKYLSNNAVPTVKARPDEVWLISVDSINNIAISVGAATVTAHTSNKVYPSPDGEYLN